MSSIRSGVKTLASNVQILHRFWQALYILDVDRSYKFTNYNYSMHQQKFSTALQNYGPSVGQSLWDQGGYV